MADNFFSQFDPDDGGVTTAPSMPSAAPADAGATAGPDTSNFFAQFDPDAPSPNQTNALGAFARSGERSLIPAAAGVVSGAAGAEAGAGIGAGIGAFFGGAGAVPGAAIGAIVGGLGAGFAGSYAADQAQTIAAKALPESWKDVLGGSDRQQQIDETYQPTASFLGGLVPYAVTLRPGGLGSAASKLPANATAWQKIAANPVTSRLFAGGLMGGMQVGQQAAAGQPINWQQAAIATGFGMVFNKPTKFGETLEGLGARMVPGAARAATAEAAPSPASPTVAQAGDAKVVGPGITEDVAMGNHQQAVPAEMSSQDAARTEASVLGTAPIPQVDVGAIARKMEPELFGQWDTLTQQQNDLRAHLTALASPSDEDIGSATQQRDDLQQQLDAHIASRGGYEGGAQARALRAQVRSQQAQIDDMATRRAAFAAGQGADTPEMTAIRQQIQATDLQLRDLAPQVAAATRRAADYTGAETVAPPEVAASQAAEPAPNNANPLQTVQNANGAPAAASPAVQEQAAAIAANVTRELISAGRPADEAEALGQLSAHRLVARAANLGNTISPLDLYNQEGAVIRGAQGSPTMLPKAAPEPPEPAIDPDAARQVAESTGQAKLIEQLIGRGASNKEIASVISRKLSEDQIAAFRKTVTPKAPLMPTEEQPEIGTAPEVATVEQIPMPAEAEVAQGAVPATSAVLRPWTRRPLALMRSASSSRQAAMKAG